MYSSSRLKKNLDITKITLKIKWQILLTLSYLGHINGCLFHVSETEVKGFPAMDVCEFISLSTPPSTIRDERGSHKLTIGKMEEKYLISTNIAMIVIICKLQFQLWHYPSLIFFFRRNWMGWLDLGNVGDERDDKGGDESDAGDAVYGGGHQ